MELQADLTGMEQDFISHIVFDRPADSQNDELTAVLR
jgi:hypothetical protein